MTKDAIFARIRDILVSEFEIEAAAVQNDARLYEELDLDSIDAVDMVVKMKEYIPGKIDPALFKNVRTVRDVVELLFPLVQAETPVNP